jgi:hypothetical protein
MKEIWLKYKKIVVLVCLFAGLVALAFVAGKCSTKRVLEQQVSNIIALKDSIGHLTVKIKGVQNQVWEKNAIIIGQEDAIKAGLVREELLKKIHMKDLVTNTELSGTIHRQDSLLGLPPKTEYITIKDSSGVKRNYVRYPFQLLEQHDKYLNLDAGLDSTKKAWFKLDTPFSGSISIGYVGTGFLNLKLVPKGIFSTENKYIKINTMDVVIIQDNQRWIDKWWVHSLIGVGVWEGVRRGLTGKF